MRQQIERNYVEVDRLRKLKYKSGQMVSPSTLTPEATLALPDYTSEFLSLET